MSTAGWVAPEKTTALRARVAELESLMGAQPADLSEAQVDALAAAGNRALNDAIHDDVCACDAWPEACRSSSPYWMGYWDTSALDTAMPAVIGLWESMRAAGDAGELGRLRARVAELETELGRYVGHEPTIAEELAFRGRCLDAVHAVCDDAERQATRWEQPLPVPEWVETVRTAAGCSLRTVTSDG
ncbi:hypothetical protein [Streptomyces jumonjinensis]|uniref:hypothetical protein n=1 Tax=Streptomyces jumonjinensis TaxID=1945 RepID=UPI0037987D6E